jgi:hypothetical protein
VLVIPLTTANGYGQQSKKAFNTEKKGETTEATE